MIAFVGVVGAAVYALRLFITGFHNRVGAKVSSREIGLADALVLVPLVLIILVLAFYPQFGLKRSEPSVRAAVAPAAIQSHIPGRLLQVASR